MTCQIFWLIIVCEDKLNPVHFDHALIGKTMHSVELCPCFVMICVKAKIFVKLSDKLHNVVIFKQFSPNSPYAQEA